MKRLHWSEYSDKEWQGIVNSHAKMQWFMVGNVIKNWRRWKPNNRRFRMKLLENIVKDHTK